MSYYLISNRTISKNRSNCFDDIKFLDEKIIHSKVSVSALFYFVGGPDLLLN